MKFLLPFISALYYTYATIVVFNDPLDEKIEKTFLSFEKTVEVKNLITFCIRLNNKGSMSSQVIFSSYDNEVDRFALIVEIEVSRGYLFLDGKKWVWEKAEENFDLAKIHQIFMKGWAFLLFKPHWSCCKILT